MASSKPHFVPSADPASIVVPGVDPTLPPAVQIEQIDQLITDRLASIDNNMAKAHHILTTQILPSVQRFAQATQPTRDAARFWKSFFELAAQVRVPEEGDYSQLEPELPTEMHEAHPEEHDETSGGAEETGNETVTEDTTMHAHQRDEPAAQMTPSSFLSAPGHSGVEHSFSNVVSSTPARPQHAGHDISIASTDVPAWSPSHGSLVTGAGVPSSSNAQSGTSAPAIRPTKAAATLLTDFSFSSGSESSAFQPPSPSTDGTSQTTSSFEMGVPVPQRPKGKGKTADLRQKVLRRNSKGGAGPGTPKLSKYNPFKPPTEGGEKWN
ncbi:DASH complex subunit ask1, partial [Tulasnella sp. 417]